MGAVKSKQKRVRGSRSSTFSSGFSSYNNYNNNNNNPILHHSRSEPTTPHYEPIQYTNINDNLINIVNIINNLQQNNNNNNTTPENTPSSSSNNNSEDKNATENNENDNNKVRRKKHTIRDSFGDEILLFDCNSIVLDKDDQFSRSTGHVIWRILALLSMRELCNVQQVSHFWYIAGKENEIWKSILLRDSHIWESTSRGLINTLKIGHTPVKWKKIAKEECSLLECWKCKRKFQKCKNSSVACMYHPQGRELIEDKIGAPSGVYWTCCLNKSRVSPGCVIGYHSEFDWSKETKEKGKKKDNNNNNRVRVASPAGLRGWRVSL